MRSLNDCRLSQLSGVALDIVGQQQTAFDWRRFAKGEAKVRASFQQEPQGLLQTSIGPKADSRRFAKGE